MSDDQNTCRCRQEEWFLGDVECVNGVLIDIDVFTEGWPRDVFYPLAPCHPKACNYCGGTGTLQGEEDDIYDCHVCDGSGATDGNNDSQERLAESCARPVGRDG